MNVTGNLVEKWGRGSSRGSIWKQNQKSPLITGTPSPQCVSLTLEKKGDERKIQRKETQLGCSSWIDQNTKQKTKQKQNKITKTKTHKSATSTWITSSWRVNLASVAPTTAASTLPSRTHTRTRAQPKELSKNIQRTIRSCSLISLPTTH